MECCLVTWSKILIGSSTTIDCRFTQSCWWMRQEWPEMQSRHLRNSRVLNFYGLITIGRYRSANVCTNSVLKSKYLCCRKWEAMTEVNLFDCWGNFILIRVIDWTKDIFLVSLLSQFKQFCFDYKSTTLRKIEYVY